MRTIHVLFQFSIFVTTYNIIVSPTIALQQLQSPIAREFSAKVISESNANSRRAFISTLISGSVVLTASNTVKAACLTGDASEQCIGVYKVPIDDGILAYIDTPEKLQTYAPDLNWIPPVSYPKTYDEAIQEFNGMGNYIKGARDFVSKGSLTAAGVQLLQMIPRFTVCGRVILQTLQQREDIQGLYPLIEDGYTNLYVQMQNCDVMIGQGLRGEMGVSAVAQIHILTELKQIEFDYNFFLKQVVAL